MSGRDDQLRAALDEALQERYAEALAALDCSKFETEVPDKDHDFWAIWRASAAAVLAVRDAELEQAQTRLRAIHEAVLLWRDQTAGDIGLAIALGRILDTDQPEPAAVPELRKAHREMAQLRVQLTDARRWRERAEQAEAELKRVRAEAQSMLENGCKALEESAWARHAAEQRAEQAEQERDQYASAIRHLLQTVRHTAYVWSQTLPETVRTADVVKALSGLCSHVPVRDDLRDDLWQRIVGAYYVRFENDGHPEDSKAAADEAMAIVQPELERRDAALERVQAVCAQLPPNMPDPIETAAAHTAGWNDAMDKVQAALGGWPAEPAGEVPR